MNKETFGERLLLLLKSKRWSQRKVAEALNISRTAVNKWTKGGMIDDTNLERLADYLGVDKIWLKYGEGYGGEINENQQLLTRHINDFYLHESSQVVTWEWDIITDEVRYSNNVEQVYGMTIRNNHDFFSLMTKKSQDELLAAYTKIIQEGGTHEIEFKISQTQNDEGKWIKSRAVGVKGKNGKITKIVGISIDNTKQKNEEITLLQQQCFFNFLLQQQSNLVLFIDRDGGIITSNCNAHNVNFLKLQSFLYQLALELKISIDKIIQQGHGALKFQGRDLFIKTGLDQRGYIFLMLQVTPNDWS